MRLLAVLIPISPFRSSRHLQQGLTILQELIGCPPADSGNAGDMIPAHMGKIADGAEAGPFQCRRLYAKVQDADRKVLCLRDLWPSCLFLRGSTDLRILWLT